MPLATAFKIKKKLFCRYPCVCTSINFFQGLPKVYVFPVADDEEIAVLPIYYHVERLALCFYLEE
jgi:hypothetical protein